jgi:ribonuclease-3 family protein
MSDMIAPGTAALAYLGDSVIELWVREKLVRSGLPGSRELNAEAIKYVTAPAQAVAVKVILPLLSEEEEAMFRRGRNLGHSNLPKNATATEYRAATGLETLVGWLHLAGNSPRINELLSAGYGNQAADNRE